MPSGSPEPQWGARDGMLASDWHWAPTPCCWVATYLYALLAAGELGVHHMLERFRQQIDEALVFLGVDSVHQVGPSF